MFSKSISSLDTNLADYAIKSVLVEVEAKIFLLGSDGHDLDRVRRHTGKIWGDLGAAAKGNLRRDFAIFRGLC